MRRRTYCRAVVLGTGMLAGCSGRLPSDQPGARHRPPETDYGQPTADQSTPTATQAVAPDLELAIETETTDAGFHVVATVENAGSTPADVTLVALWTKDDRRQERARHVELGPGATGTYEFTFPELGSLAFEWRRR
ncbi:hypothetical protein [Haloarchaeobius sp. HRN-SO-5]|uniref:hypothetical protein n=1 Tax=Haloarchaeobius sp. HRN-SO-5 TaxID=3446118 RepID=UPI003EBC70F2